MEVHCTCTCTYIHVHVESVCIGMEVWVCVYWYGGMGLCVLVRRYGSVCIGTEVWVCVYWYRDVGLELFGCHIISPVRVQSRVVKGILSLITKER